MKLLQADCHSLDAEGQEVRAELEEKVELIQSLQEECQQLRQQFGEQQGIMGNKVFCKCEVYEMRFCVCVCVGQRRRTFLHQTCLLS